MEELVTFKTAKLAKEKGWNPLNTEKVKLAYVDTRNNDHIHFDYFIIEGFNAKPVAQSCNTSSSWFEGLRGTYILNKSYDNGYEWILRPSQSVLAKWLREVHKIRVLPYQGVSGNFKVDIFTYPIPNTVGKWERFNNIQSYNTFEQALEEGLFEALKLIK